MIILTEEEVLQVITRLKNAGLNYKPVQDELLDHLCCQVEARLAEGAPFEIALDTAFKTFKEDEFKDIQQQILKTKSFFMYRVPLFIFGFLFLLIGSYFLKQAKTMAQSKKTAEEVIHFHPEDIFQSPYHNPTALLASLDLVVDPPNTEPLSEYKITSGFGMRKHPIYKSKRQHNGIDLAAPKGTPVKVTADGEVLKVDHHKGYGNHVIIKHDDVYQTLYAQLSETSVKEGQKVKKGEVIGKVGSSGMATAPHLHYEVIENGIKVDPKPFFTP